MNAKNSLILLLAIMLIVSQLVDEDSTIAHVAASDADEIQMAMEEGEAAIERATAAPSVVRTASRPTRTDATSLDDFYGAVEEEDSEQFIEPEVTDEGGDTESDDGVDGGRMNSSDMRPEESGNQPFDPRVG